MLVIFQDQTGFAHEASLDHCLFDGAQDKHFRDAVSPVFRQDAERDESHPLNPALVIKQFRQPDRQAESRQPSVNFSRALR